MHMELVWKQKENNENIVNTQIIWFIDSADLCFILILKEKIPSF